MVKGEGRGREGSREKFIVQKINKKYKLSVIAPVAYFPVC